MLARALRFAPAGVHVAVVDPGVGGRGARWRCAGRTRSGCSSARTTACVPAAERFGGVAEAVEVSASPVAEPVSATFHGRDVFAPVAARLAAGAALREAGPLEPATLVALELPRPAAGAGRRGDRGRRRRVRQRRSCTPARELIAATGGLGRVGAGGA